MRRAAQVYKEKKLKDDKKIKRMGRPRNARIDAIQNFYGQTFRDKKGNELKMFKKV